jgi:hypothetical protein
LAVIALVLIAPAVVFAQASEPAPPPPVAYASASELNHMVSLLNQTSQSMQTNLGKLRVERWKTDNGSKRQAQANVDSVQRNLQSALPEIVNQLNAAPEDLAASFKLYRNLDALYDVFGSIIESAGAFGSKDEFQSLANDMSAIEGLRRSLGERIQTLAAAKEADLVRLRAEIKTAQAAPPPPPTKIIVDDNEPPKKVIKKKPAAATTKPKTSTTTGTTAKPSAATPAKPQ